MEIDEGKMKKLKDLLDLVKELNGQMILFENNFVRVMTAVDKLPSEVKGDLQ